jgi:hypothetical protein
VKLFIDASATVASGYRLYLFSPDSTSWSEENRRCRTVVRPLLP